MRVSIIRIENHVYLDGECFTVDCSNLPDDFHALQWYDTKGEIEFVNDPLADAKGYKYNKRIDDISPWQKYIDKAEKVKKELEECLLNLAQKSGQEILPKS